VILSLMVDSTIASTRIRAVWHSRRFDHGWAHTNERRDLESPRQYRRSGATRSERSIGSPSAWRELCFRA